MEILGLIAGILLAFGIWGIWSYVMGKFKVKGKRKELKELGLILLFLFSAFFGAYLFISAFWQVLWRKIFGFVMFGLGYFLISKFPDISDYQTERMTLLGIFLGLILFFSGLYWLLF